MDYRIHSRDHLRRARQRLDEDTPMSLFYAALELRCGIEVRMRQYLEAQSHISKKMKKGWQIARLAKNIEKVFKSGDKVVEFAIYDREGRNLLDVLYYTPVNAKLRKMGEQLGNYLHAMETRRPREDPWWAQTRNFFEDVYTELKKANFGTLIGVPLLDPKTKALSMAFEQPENESPDSTRDRIGRTGVSRMLSVRYLDRLPSQASNIER